MAHTNSTTNYGLPQWIGTDKPTFLGDFNRAFSDIDTAMKNNSDAATSAVSTANSAATAATTASTNATTALNTANSAATDAATAVTTAGAADTKATQALAAASTAETAAAANTITNLAPAYDSTLTYAVGDLVTYVDAQGSGKLYKCIVAVGTPEEFNINKWDDVTTSEVYGKPEKVISTATADGVKTFSDIYNELFVSPNTNKRYIIELNHEGNISQFYSSFISATEIHLNTYSADGVSTLIQTVRMMNTSSTAVLITLGYNNTITYTDRSSVIPASGDVFKLVEI